MRSTSSLTFAAAGFALVGCLSTGAFAGEAWPSLEQAELGHGAYSRMHMMLQKTFLRINVATIDVRVDKPTQARLTTLVGNQAYSEALAAPLAQAAMGSERAVVQMQFARDVSLKRWIGVVHESLEQARKAGLITADMERRVKEGVPQWFGALKDRGYEKGDRLIYGIEPGATRMLVVTAAGQALVDRADPDPGARRVVLSSYFAPGSEFREPLLRSLWEKRP